VVANNFLAFFCWNTEIISYNIDVMNIKSIHTLVESLQSII
jgi:hypothetical protein